MFRKVNDFYSHIFNSEGDIVVAYFVTKTGTEYRVYFYPARDYSSLIENYFNLVNKHSIIFLFHADFLYKCKKMFFMKICYCLYLDFIYI